MTLNEQITTLVSLLENYGKHHRWCRYHNGGNDIDCNCGFVRELKDAQELRDAANERTEAEIAHHAMTGE